MGAAAFSIGHVHFYWYGLIIAFSLLIWLVITIGLVRRAGIPSEPVLDLLLLVVPGTVFFARSLYVLTHWGYYKENLWSILFLWNGGLSMTGAVIGGVLTFFLAVRWLRLEPLYWLDLITPGLAFGIAISQCGDFFNQQNFGYPTDSPWGIYIDFLMRPQGFEQYDFFQPVFLYAFAWCLTAAIATTLVWVMKDRFGRFPFGSVFLLYIFLYFVGRLFLDPLVLSGSMSGGWATGPIFDGVVAASSLLVFAVRRMLMRPAAD